MCVLRIATCVLWCAIKDEGGRSKDIFSIEYRVRLLADCDSRHAIKDEGTKSKDFFSSNRFSLSS